VCDPQRQIEARDRDNRVGQEVIFNVVDVARWFIIY
jgi:hypothetical protein